MREGLRCKEGEEGEAQMLRMRGGGAQMCGVERTHM
jgi:hypothetical protein